MIISPSILSADFARLESELAEISTSDFAHIDVMDGHFVPNLTLGAPVVARLAQVSPIPVDCHLMIDDPDRWAPDYVVPGVEWISFHAEAAAAPIRLARHLHSLGVKVGLALRPATPVEPYIDILAEFDRLLVMTVEPGFGGQSFISSMLPKLRRAREASDRLGLEIDIQADGGVDTTTIAPAVAAGASNAVAGSSVFGQPDRPAAIAALRAAATS